MGRFHTQTAVVPTEAGPQPRGRPYKGGVRAGDRFISSCYDRSSNEKGNDGRHAAAVATGRRRDGSGECPGVTAPAAADEYGDPQYPSEAWFAREQANWARTREAPLRQANDPAFQKRLYEQSLVNVAGTQRRRVEESGWQWG